MIGPPLGADVRLWPHGRECMEIENISGSRSCLDHQPKGTTIHWPQLSLPGAMQPSQYFLLFFPISLMLIKVFIFLHLIFFNLLSNCSNLLHVHQLQSKMHLDTFHPSLEVGHSSKGQLIHDQVASHYYYYFENLRHIAAYIYMHG